MRQLAVTQCSNEPVYWLTEFALGLKCLCGSQLPLWIPITVCLQRGGGANTARSVLPLQRERERERRLRRSGVCFLFMDTKTNLIVASLMYKGSETSPVSDCWIFKSMCSLWHRLLLLLKGHQLYIFTVSLKQNKLWSVALRVSQIIIYNST